MRKVLFVVLLLSSLMLFAVSCSKKDDSNVVVSAGSYTFTEGVDYKVLDLPDMSDMVYQVYSFYCVYCEQYEKMVNPAIKAHLAEKNTGFDFIYYAYKGTYGRQAFDVMSVLWTLDRSDNVTPSRVSLAKSLYYKEVLINRDERFKSAEDFIAYGLGVAGVSTQQYEELSNSQEVSDIRAEWSAISEIVGEEYGTPAIVVRGKYLILAQTITSEEMLLAEIDYLLSK